MATPTSAIGSVTSAASPSPSPLGSTSPSTAASALSSSLNADTFMQLFTKQLANQDPMNPMDSSQFLNQFSQITQVQSVAELTKTMGNFQNTMTSMLNSNKAAQAEGILGKQVQYTDSTGVQAAGTVSAMSIAPDGSVSLNIGGSAVDLSSITQINP